MKILHLEDNPRDATLVADRLEAEWAACCITVVSTREDFVAALARGGDDIILSDFKLPGFSGSEALALAREHRPDTPFIFLSGTIGEDAAVEIVHAGAADYVLKDRMQRLPLAIQRALRDGEDRRQRHRADAHIREQAELLDKARDGIVVTNDEDIILFWNQGAERIFGWSAHDAVGKNILALFDRAANPDIEIIHRQMAANDEWRGELRLNHKQGQAIVTDVSVTLIRDIQDQPKSRLCIITDITEQKKLEENLFHAQRLESLGMLAAGIAHDLNNALAPMLMAGQILSSRVTDPSDLRLLEMLERSAGRGAALVKQILSFASGGSREKSLVQTKHLLRDILDLIQQTFPKSIVVEHDFPHDLWTVRGNPTQLHQILLNLCINARDAMPQGGMLRLRANNETLSEQGARALPNAIPGNFLVFEVTDTGTGISPAVQERIWEPFFTTKDEGKGTGLGLSTVRGIAASHGGFVTLDSAVGRGSTFRVFLPAAVEYDPTALSPGSAHPFAGRGEGELVFVVDDDAGIRESITAVLAKHGYHSIALADGVEALAQYAVRADKVSLVITDLDMPRLSGLALGQAILRLNPAMNIILISGNGESNEIAATPGITHLAKPFSPDALLAKVYGLLQGKAVRR